MAAKYAVNPLFAAAYPNAVTLIDGVPVALVGKDLTITKKGTVTHPPSTRVVKGASQAQLQYLFEKERNPHIIETAEKDDK